MDLENDIGRNWENSFIDSIIPEICKIEPCILGIDEAGRGPVLGPMVYGICYCPKKWEKNLKSLGAADSKTLTEVKREDLLKLIHQNNKFIGWSLDVISPMYISNCMYEIEKISLNEVSQSSAIKLVQRVIECGVNIAEIYVDTVGDPLKYQTRLEELFPRIAITVSKKADSIYSIVSAASICAKVARDKMLSSWKFPESIEAGPWGSGYPGDSITKNFLVSSLDCVFGFPGLVRFSWSTAEKVLEGKGFGVKWLHEEVVQEATPSVLQFFAKKRKNGNENESQPQSPVINKRNFYFENRYLKRIVAI